MGTARSVDDVMRGFAAVVGDAGPVTVRGNQTRWALGGEIDPAAIEVSAPSGIVAYSPAEMTVKVRAGTTVADLHSTLAAQGQRTSLPDRGGTVGGAIAVGQNHIEMLGRGRMRDAVLQVSYVSAEGKVVTGGGPTVKNVTGFDLPRLITGSLGTLGLIGEVILRTNPIPTTRRWLLAPGIDPAAVVGHVLNPSAVLWDGASTWVLLEGHEPDVDTQASALAKLGAFTDTDGPPPLPEYRWSVQPSDLAELVSGADGTTIGVFGTGLAFADRPQPARPRDPAIGALHTKLKTLFDPTGRLNPGRQP